VAEAREPLDDQQYFQAIEERFLELRGAPLLLSPSDWRVAQKWNRAGIPLPLVLRTLEEIFARRREREADGRVSGLRYCNSAVEATWRQERELQATVSRGGFPAETLDIAARLQRLAASVPRELPGFAQVTEAIRAAVAEPTSHLVEQRLAQIENEWLSRVIAGDGELDLDAVLRDVETRLASLAATLPKEDLDTHRERLRRQKIRVLYGLPSLSIFAPEASPETD
jgi:hypothetical protein